MRLSQSPVPEFLCWTRTSSKGPSDLKPHPPPRLSLIPVSQCCPPHKALALSPALSSNLTPLRSLAPCLQDGSWEAVTNVLGGESSAKYKTHSHPWLQKIPRLPHPSPSPLPPGGGARETSKHHHAAAVATASPCALQLRPAKAANAPGLYRSSGTRHETGRLDPRTTEQLRRQAFLWGSSLFCLCPLCVKWPQTAHSPAKVVTL